MLKFKKGFTLIELLVVIAVMAVVASAVLVLINPVDKINSANDSKAQADIGQIATALTAYAAANNGIYVTSTGNFATDMNVLKTAGELSNVPTPTTGYTYTYSNTGGVTPTVKLTATVLSKKYSAALAPGPYNVWMWCNTSSAAAPKLDATVACP